MDTISLISRTLLSLPRIKGVGILLDWFSRLYSRTDRDVISSFAGTKFIANPSNPDGRVQLFTAQYHDRAERAFVQSTLRPGDHFVDVGANHGNYTRLAAKLVGARGKVTAIEAEPGNSAALRRNIALNDFQNVTVVEKGAADERATLRLHINPRGHGMHSFLVDAGPDGVEVECLPLSEILGCEPIRLMKIDIEGFEARVLRRMFEDEIFPEFIMLEAWCELEDPVPVCRRAGYREIMRAGPNVMLAR